MDIRELRSFLLLSEQLHFGRAAGLLHLSQPALTKQIRRLEEELGSSLFERGKHGTSPTAFGIRFAQEARAVVDAFDRLVERGRKAARGETGILHLGFGFHTIELVPRLVVKLRKVAPGIEVTLRDMSTAEQVEGLESGEIDLGFVRMPVGHGFATLPVIRDRLALVSSASSALAEHATLKDCRNEPFVALSEKRAPGYYNHMLRLCALHGYHPRVVQQVPEVTTALALVRAGLGVAVVPESFRTGNFDGIRMHPLKEKEAGWSVAAAWRKGDTNPALGRFLGLLRQEVAEKKAGRT
jgi:DNA-binding transcriptional LysR family regulator